MTTAHNAFREFFRSIDEGEDRETARLVFTQSLVVAWQQSLLNRLENAAQAYDDCGDGRGASALRAFATGVAEGLGRA